MHKMKSVSECTSAHQFLTVITLCRLLERVYKEGMWYLLSILEGAVYPERSTTPNLLVTGVELRRDRDSI